MAAQLGFLTPTEEEVLENDPICWLLIHPNLSLPY